MSLVVLSLIVLTNVGYLPLKSISLFIILVSAASLGAFYFPQQVFALFLVTLPLENINLVPESLGFAVRPYQLLGAAIFIGLIARFGVRKEKTDLPKWNGADWAVLALVVSGFVSVLGALDQSTALKQSVILATFFVLYLLVRFFIRSAADLKRNLIYFSSGAVPVVLYGIWQNVRFAKGLESFATMPGRPNATFTEPDWLGIFLVLCLAVIYAIIYYFVIACGAQQSNDQDNKLLATSYWSLVTLIYILLILTVSRSAWLGALAVTAIFLLLVVTRLKSNPREWRWKETLPIKAGILASFVLAVAVVQFFSLTTFQLWNRFGSTGSGLQRITVSCRTDIALPEQIQSIAELRNYGCRHINLEDIKKEKALGNLIREVSRPDPNFDIRREIYATAWETFKERPFLGIGWGNGYRIFGFDARGAALNSSNLFIETWLGSGLLGLISLICLFGLLILRSLRTFLQNENQTTSLFVLLGLTAIIIPNLFNAGMFLGFFWVFLGIAASLIYEKS